MRININRKNNASGSQYIPIGEETGIIHTVVKN